MLKSDQKTKKEGPITVNEIRNASEEILVLSKHLEDMLKELYLEAEIKKQDNILNIHKRMYKKLRELKKKIITANVRMQDLTTEIF
jgi:hypothetical protein